MATSPQDTAARALTRAVHYADKAASYADGSTHNTEHNAPVIAALGGLAAVYADIAKAAALLANNS
ncbi:hypothetical protein [Streptomyces sp. NPDC091416]|uniref:hypothetical protein n=1 Tax=Streptomyces sp. NPDC091416 TaxID=3366003 RepID=UPI0037F2A232